MPSDEDTLLETVTARRAEPTHRSELPLEPDGAERRYELGALIGRGGMGEVRAAADMRIDREVAVKLMRTELLDAATTKRFLREARVQGSLEHPAVPPVYDLGLDRDGKPYFVMKKLAGLTLQDVIAADTLPRSQLLARFVDVCFAIGFAHARGVVHRDIKPSNIMLGEFNEVYVLDWGLARLGDDDASVPTRHRPRSDSETATGDLLGTPGYMAPEQARGAQVTDRADVFSLGCVLYEILTGVPALPRGLAAITATLEADALSPRARDADVPPELDKLCARATAQDPAMRPSARELADKLQAYLDGDRDLERRRQLANEHAAAARDALGAGDDDESRARAMREVGRALVFDSTNAAAKQVLSELLLAPDRIPAEALAAADAERAASRHAVLKLSVAAYATFGIVGGVLFALPIRVVWPVVTVLALCWATAAAFAGMSRKQGPLATNWELVVVVANTALLISVGILFGPLFLTPNLAMASYAIYLTQPIGHGRWLVAVSHAAGFAVPLVLELAGILPSTFETANGGLLLNPWALELSPFVTALSFTLALGVQGAIAYKLLGRGVDAQISAQNRVHSQHWHLHQILPKT